MAPRRKFNKSYKKKRRIKKKKRVSSSKVTAILQDALTVPDVLCYEDITEVEIGASTALTLPCRYFTCRQNLYNHTPGASIGDPFSHNDPLILVNIGSAINTGVNPSVRFSVQSWRLKHDIQNTSTSVIRITAYKCMWRRDVPLSSTYATYPVALLGNGFLNAGAGTGSTSANTYLSDDRSDPFQSPEFCLWVKVLKTRTRSIECGKSIHFSLSHKKPFMVHPNMLTQMTSGQTYLTATQMLDYQKGGQFYLFKLSCEELASGAANASLTGVVANSCVVRMRTDMKWSYKYINTLSSTTLVYPTFGLTAGGGLSGGQVFNVAAGTGTPPTALT